MADYNEPPSKTAATALPRLQKVRYEIEDRVAWLTIDNEQMRNALTDQVQRDLFAALRHAAEDPQLRAVVITGAGDKAFCSGGDIAFFRTLDNVSGWHYLKNRGAEICRLIETMDKPVIAMVNGLCLAGGMELALCCDIVYAAETAVFGLVEARIGLLPGWGGTVRLPRAIPVRRAKEMIMTGEMIGAEEAKALGFVNKTFPQERLRAETEALLGRLKDTAPLAIQACKNVVFATANVESMDAAMAIERGATLWLSASTDVGEGITAFLEKRAPRFTGS